MGQVCAESSSLGASEAYVLLRTQREEQNAQGNGETTQALIVGSFLGRLPMSSVSGAIVPDEHLQRAGFGKQRR